MILRGWWQPYWIFKKAKGWNFAHPPKIIFLCLYKLISITKKSPYSISTLSEKSWYFLLTKRPSTHHELHAASEVLRRTPCHHYKQNHEVSLHTQYTVYSRLEVCRQKSKVMLTWILSPSFEMTASMRSYSFGLNSASLMFSAMLSRCGCHIITTCAQSQRRQ